MQRRAALVALSLVLLLAACEHEKSSAGGPSGVRGIVLAGPQCPVESATSPCPDEPLAGVEVDVLVDNEVVAKAETDADGRFEIELEPGEYVIEALVQDSGPMFGRPISVTVPEERFVEITVPVDTGIR